MATISQNQYDYLNNLVAGGGGNAEWAKAQLSGATVEAPKPVQSTPTTSNTAPKYTTSVGSSTPSSSYTTTAPNYSTPSTPTYTAPSYSTPSQSYTGAANIVGNTSGFTSNNLGTNYTNVADSVRAANPGQNQVNTWTDSNTGNIYNTTNMTPQQTYALMLNKQGNTNAAAILQGMGLDINGNPTSSTNIYRASSTPTYTSSPTPSSSTLTSSQQSAQDWINNADSGQGGISNYINQQLSRYNQAVQSGDTGLQQRLLADSQRVGYSLPNAGAGFTQPTGTSSGGSDIWRASSGGNSTDLKQITDFYNTNVLNPQTLAIQQALAQAQQSRQLAMTQNQNALNESLSRMNQSDAVSRQIAQELANRRGNFYSGGLDYQLGNIDRTSAENRSNLERDYGAYVQNYNQQNALDAQQAAEKIASLQAAAPAAIQQRLQEALSARSEAEAKAAQQAQENAIKTAGVTGYYIDPQVQQIQQQMAQNSESWFNASPAEQARLAAENQRLGKLIGIGQDSVGDWQYTGGSPTLARENQEYNQADKDYQRAYTVARDQIKDAQWQAKFDQDTEQWGLEFAAEQAYKNGLLSIQERNAATSAAREARLSESANSGNSEGSSKSKPASEINLIGDDLLKKYGKVTYDSNKQPKYSYPENEDKQAEAVLEILNLNYNDSDTIKLLNKLGITESRAHELLGEG